MSLSTFSHSMIADIEAGFHAIVHKLGLDHGIPTEAIEAAKAAGSALLPTVEALAIPALDKEIQAEVPAVLVPAVEAVVQAEEGKLEESVAPSVQ